MNYYEGHLINVNDLKYFNYYLDIISSRSNSFCLDMIRALKDLSQATIIHPFYNSKTRISKETIDNMVIDMISPNPTFEIGESIIYIKKTDEQGNEYGKELITGLVFPIKNEYSSYDIVYSLEDIKQLFLDKESSEVYTFGKTSLNRICLTDKTFKRENYVPHNEQYKLANMFIDEEREIIINDKKVKLVCVAANSFKVNIEPQMYFHSNMKVNYAITRETLANELKVYDYFLKYGRGFVRRKRRKEHYELLENMYINNRLGDISFIENEEKEGIVKVKKTQY